MSPSDQMGADLKAARKTIRELVEALRPLAECEIIEPDVPLRDTDSARYFIRMGEIRRARQAITNAEGKT